MYRLFKTHDIRKAYEADALWDFETEDGGYKGKLAVPSCWETVPALASYKGKAVYTKNLYFGGNIRFVFKGVSHTADVYCDGKLIAHHYNAYTPFNADVFADYSEHTIKIVVDNSYSQDSVLHKENDYYTYGGIIRPLIIEELNKAVINYINFEPFMENEKWKARIKLNIESKSDTEEAFELHMRLNNRSFSSYNISIPANSQTVFEYVFDFEDVCDYSPENPVLYTLKAELYQGENAIDDLIEKVGFREIKTEGKKLLLNGKPIKLKGFNRHESYNSLGCSIPLQAMMRDIALIKETGANSIRTSHYPNDELFLDLCDETGLLVWEEAHARALNADNMSNPNFIPQSFDCIDEMIINHYNHPSIFCWGILNECVSDTDFGRECYSKLYNRICENDTSRPKTSASNRNTTDICFDLEEIVSVNLYSRWYSFHPDNVSDGIKDIKNHMKETGNDNKPFIISEIGAGAIYGYRSDTNCKWSEERQAQILDEQLSAVLADDDICGVFVWQFCDCRVDESWFVNRPKTENNKGIVDEFRRKKLSYATVKKHFSSKPLYICEL